ncbi:MAG: ribonuclease P protein component [Chloroflexota bacterium]|nr:ribonuclease P protein component [Chloroflexota bacterium]
MRKEQRLRRRKDFAAAYRTGRVQSDRLLVLRVAPNGSNATRFGFVAGKVVGGAVVRNKIKRRLREAARRTGAAVGFDIVIGARKPCAAASYRELREALYILMKRAAVLAEPAPAEGQQSVQRVVEELQLRPADQSEHTQNAAE